MSLPASLIQFLGSVHPYDSLSFEELDTLAGLCSVEEYAVGQTVFEVGQTVSSLYVIVSGEIEITDDAGVQLSLLGSRNSFGERALLSRNSASRTASVLANATLILIPDDTLFALLETYPKIQRFFDRRRPARVDRKDLTTLPVDQFMSRDPVTCGPETSIRDAAAMMHERNISSVCIVDDTGLRGIVTVRDMNGHVVAKNADTGAPVSTIMTEGLLALAPEALGTDVLHLMMERHIGHVPIVQENRLVGIVTQTDLTRVQALSSGSLVGRISDAEDAAEMAHVTAEIPQLLAQLVGTGNQHDVVTRLVTDIADTATRRLLALAEEKLGPPPVSYLWLACGSQGRQEQTGVSDQDNCLILSDDVTDADMPYFQDLARLVSDGLDECGYYFCPGDMMATNPRWCQPIHVWQDYFSSWIAKPNPEAQMLASVMFDLRPIGGDASLFADLKAKTLENAARNSIFTAHMISNSIKHHPPLGLLRGLATIRSGEHRNRIDLKHNGVVPIVDLGRIYALQGKLTAVNTRARLEEAKDAGILSTSGGADLLDAYDLIATLRLEHQAKQVKKGEKPDNFLDPSDLSDFERSHLRDAFVVVKTMQSAVSSGKGTLG